MTKIVTFPTGERNKGKLRYRTRIEEIVARLKEKRRFPKVPSSAIVPMESISEKLPHENL